MSDVVGRIRQAAPLQTDEDVEAFGAALDDLPDVLSLGLLRDLHLSFDDDAAEPGVMYDLLHRIEDAPAGIQEAAFVAVAAEMAARSPWWAETVLIRMLNNPTSRTEVVSRTREADSANKLAIRHLLAQIGEGSDSVASIARAVSAELAAR